jgi:chorismate mutase-like protein
MILIRKIKKQVITTPALNNLLGIYYTLNVSEQLFFDMQLYNPFSQAIRENFIDACLYFDDDIKAKRLKRKMSLVQLRKEIDRVDKRLVELIVKRLALIPKVAEYKIKHNIPRHVPEREKAILKQKRKLAKGKGIDPDLIEDVIKRIIEESHKVERKIMGR